MTRRCHCDAAPSLPRGGPVRARRGWQYTSVRPGAESRIQSYPPLMTRQHRPRLTTVGMFGFAAGWEWTDTDAQVVRRLIVFLEDRRALAYGRHRANRDHVVASILTIRDELTSALQELAPQSGANRSVRALREATLRFLDRVPSNDEPQEGGDFAQALSELQADVAVYVRLLADRYEVTVDGPLAQLLRAADDEDERKRLSAGDDGS